MRIWIVFPIAAGLAVAQYAPGSLPRSYGYSAAGFGNVTFPGGAPAHPVINPGQIARPPGNITDTSFGSALGATVRGVPPYGGGFPNGRGGPGPRTIVVPFPVMGFPGYGYGYQPEPATVVVQQPAPMPQQQPPVVIINQNYKPDTIQPQVRDYTDLPEPALKVYENRKRRADEDKPTIFLIAMRDGTVMQALAFWVEDDTLNYITRDSVQNRISLDRIDRDTSVTLNQERGLEFRLR